MKFCSPPLSSSSCSSSSSTSSSIAYSKNSKSLDLSSDIFQTSYLNTNCELSKKVNAPTSTTLCSNCDTSTTFLSNSINPYNHLNNSIFSISLQQQQQQHHQNSLNDETHIYHEINTSPKQPTQSNMSKTFLYENNLNYLVMPPQPPVMSQFSSYNPNGLNLRNSSFNNFFKEESNFLNLSDQKSLVNDFSNSLFV